MILHTLTLDAVGPYADRETVEFAHDPRRPVTLIGGLNGSGKTTLIRALFHILYGARSLAELGGRRSYGAFLADLIHNGGDRAALELTLTIPGLRDDAPLTLRRRWRRTARSAAEELDVFVDGQYDEELSESWDETIEQIAPLGIARLFFFDGEKIEALADLESAASSLRTAMGSLLGLDLVEQLRTDLVAVQRRLVRASDPTSSSALEKRQGEVAAAEELAASTRRRVEELERALEDGRADHERLLDALRAAGGDLVAQRDALEEEATNARAGEVARWEELRELAADSLAPLALVPALLDGLASTTEGHERRDQGRSVLSVLEERDEWLVSELERLRIKRALKLGDLLAADRRRRADASGTPVPFGPWSSLTTIQDVRERLTSWRAAGLQCIDALDEAVAASDELDRRISRIPSPDSVRLVLDAVDESQQRLSDITDQLEEQRQLLGATEAQLARTRDRRDTELTRLAELEDGHERQQRVMRHAERAKTTLALLGNRVAERHVGRIADYTMECLGQLLRKDRLIESVEIDPETFALSLRGATGRLLRPEALSAGERQLTALALLWALARAAGRPLPVVIDTPLGRLDADHRRHVVERYLPAASHQVIVLSTDTEIDGELYELLQPTVGAERQLVTDGAGRTSVVDGYLELVPA